METVPKDLRGLRACLVCSLIKVFYKIANILSNNINSSIKPIHTEFIYIFEIIAFCNFASNRPLTNSSLTDVTTATSFFV